MSRLIASDSGEVAGIWLRLLKSLTIGYRPGKKESTYS